MEAKFRALSISQMVSAYEESIASRLNDVSVKAVAGRIYSVHLHVPLPSASDRSRGSVQFNRIVGAVAMKIILKFSNRLKSSLLKLSTHGRISRSF